jgi:fatty acid-binding protein DegV
MAADKALVAVDDGVTTVLAHGVEAVEAVSRLAEVVAGDDEIAVAVGHAGQAAAGDADALADLLDERADVREVHRYRVGPSVGAHTGPRAFGCFWWPAGAVESPL